MTIRKSHTYFIRSRRGISGFQEWGGFDYGIASGATVRSKKLGDDDIGLDGSQGNLNAGKRFRLDDGHLPEYQPRATFDEADRWVQVEIGRVAWIVPVNQSDAPSGREGSR